MKLSAVSRAFDNTPVYDAYTGVLLFNCQTIPWDGGERDSVVTQRGYVSVAPGTVVPPRRVVRLLDDIYIVGMAQNDGFNGRSIRVGLVVQSADVLAEIRTLDEATQGVAPTLAYSATNLQKFSKEPTESSEQYAEVHIHFSTSEYIPANSIITTAGKYYLVRSSLVGQAGTQIVVADEIPGPVMDSGTATVGTYNPVSEAVEGSTVTFPVVRVRWQSLFSHGTANPPQYGPDDIQIAVHTSKATMVPGTRVTLSDGVWTVKSVTQYGSVQLCRANKNA